MNFPVITLTPFTEPGAVEKQKAKSWLASFPWPENEAKSWSVSSIELVQSLKFKGHMKGGGEAISYLS